MVALSKASKELERLNGMIDIGSLVMALVTSSLSWYLTLSLSECFFRL